MKLAVLSVSNAALADLAEVSRQVSREFPGDVAIQLFYAAQPGGEKREALAVALASADFVLLDLMGAPREYEQAAIEACRRNTQGQIVPIGGDNADLRGMLRLGGFSGRDMKERMQSKAMISPDSLATMLNMAEKLGKLFPVGKLKDIKNYIQIIKYWKNADQENIRQFLCLIGRDYGGLRRLPRPRAPIVIEDTGILDPAVSCYYASVAAYRRQAGYDPAKPTVAVLFYGHSYPNRTRGCVAALMEKLTPFANVLPVAFARATQRDLAKLREILTHQTGRPVDLVVNLLAFRLGAGPMGGDAAAGVQLLTDLDAPVVHPFFMSRKDKDQWRQSPQGIHSAEFLIQVMLPELDGCIETIPIGALGPAAYDAGQDIELRELCLIEERAAKVAGRVQKWLTLRQKPNREKKVAIVCYNYPPGEDNLFGGAFLDTFASVERILNCLAAAGYQTGPLDADALRAAFTAGKLVNSGRWQSDSSDVPFIRYNSGSYSARQGDASWKEELQRQWGTPPGEIMSEAGAFLIPGITAGNVFIGLQPSRGIHEAPDRLYHDKSLLPHHQYLAFYQWLKEEFKADAILHVGTHGTLEFLPGKECGVSGDCLPDYLIGDIPHAYLYYAGNPAEAMIAKRRSHAVLVGYQPPAFIESELYGELAELEVLLQQREEGRLLDPGRVEPLEALIRMKAQERHLPEDPEDLEHELFRLRRSLIPQGLHVFGRGFKSEEAAAFMRFVLRYDRGDLPSLQQLLAEDQGLDYSELLEHDRVQELAKLDRQAAELIAGFLQSGALPRSMPARQDLRPAFERVLQFGYTAFRDSQECREEAGLLRVLDGRYLPARLAGDMVRNPAVLPTGYNLYQFDPRLVPSRVALARGAKIAQNTLEQYRQEHDRYPRSTAVVLWGLETSRTQGETLGQILCYLGIRPAPRKNQFSTTYEIIPQAELGRPRIDVVVNMCGFFRDLFPVLIEDLDDLFRRIAALDESDDANYLKANAAVIYQQLRHEGHGEEAAWELAAARLFGPAEAEYGTKVSRLIETKTWMEEKELGEMYAASLQHVYSRNYRGQAVPGLLNSHLAAVDLVSQVRSSHEYEVTDLDHYYEYFGGLAKAVETAKGEQAAVYITDTTGEKVETETVDRSIARGVRTRLLNPKWIQAMLGHPYHGAQKIRDRFENILGLAATTNRVDNWIFSGLFQTYVADETLRRKLAENNRWAYFGMLERLLECNRRGYWQATEEELGQLRRTYLEMEGDIEEGTD